MLRVLLWRNSAISRRSRARPPCANRELPKNVARVQIPVWLVISPPVRAPRAILSPHSRLLCNGAMIGGGTSLKSQSRACATALLSHTHAPAKLTWSSWSQASCSTALSVFFGPSSAWLLPSYWTLFSKPTFLFFWSCSSHVSTPSPSQKDLDDPPPNTKPSRTGGGKSSIDCDPTASTIQATSLSSTFCLGVAAGLHYSMLNTLRSAETCRGSASNSKNPQFFCCE